MINILSVIDTLGPGGAETVYLHTCTAMDPTRFRHSCVIGGEGWLADELRSRGIQPHIVPSKGSVNFTYLRKLVAIAKAERCQILTGHLHGPAIYCSLAGLALARPVVSVFHGQSDVSEQGRLAWLKRLSLRLGTNRMVFVSGRLKDTLRHALRIPEQRCAVIPNGIDVDRFRSDGSRPLRRELDLAEDRILIGAVGNLRRPKAYDVMLRAMRILREKSSRYFLAIAGEGSGTLQAELNALRNELGLARDVAFLGLRSDVAEILGSLDAYVSSSDTEGFSISCIEAMAAGAPVIATRSGGPDEIIEHGRSGLLVPTRDPEALADAIHHVASNPDLARDLRRHAQVRVSERFSLQQMLGAYGQLFENLASHSSGASSDAGEAR